jgi:hypothetical protein
MLIKRNDVKDYMGISRSVATLDTRIDQLIAEAEPEVEAWCKRTFAYDGDITKVIDGSGKIELLIPIWPIVEATQAVEVWVSTSLPRVWDSTTQLDSDDFIVDPDAGLLSRAGVSAWEAVGSRMATGACWTKGRQNVRIHWAGGYWPRDGGTKPDPAIPDVPGNLKAALNIIVADKLTRSLQLQSGQPQSALKAESISGQQMAEYAIEHDESSGFPKTATAKLRAFRFSL